MLTRWKKRSKLIIIAAAMVFLILPAAVIALFLLGNSWGLTLSTVTAQSLPQKDSVVIDYPDSYLLGHENLFEFQGKNQCAGYSAAYVMRFFGHDVLGEDAYNQMQYKLSSGYVLPQAVVDYLNENEIESKLVTSNLEQLKTHVSRGKPIIVLIGNGRHWQHYLTVVGYDEEYIYLVDTLKEESEKPYNRAMTEEDFVSQWNNKIPLFERTAFVY